MTNYVPPNSTLDVSKPTHSEDAAFSSLSQIDLKRAAAAVTEVYKNFVVLRAGSLPACGRQACEWR